MELVDTAGWLRRAKLAVYDDSDGAVAAQTVEEGRTVMQFVHVVALVVDALRCARVCACASELRWPMPKPAHKVVRAAVLIPVNRLGLGGASSFLGGWWRCLARAGGHHRGCQDTLPPVPGYQLGWG